MNYPGSRFITGTEDSLKAIRLDQLKAFHKRYYVASNAVIAIVGDLDRKAAEKLAGQLAAQLPEGKRAERLPVPALLKEAQEKRIFHPSAQTHVRMGAPGMRRGDPDYFPLYVGNHVLGGGGLVSRLNEEIREKRGLSYSVSSYFSRCRPTLKKGRQKKSLSLPGRTSPVVSRCASTAIPRSSIIW